ncbi:hypothetical protein Fot_22275 [Forsythia ovata]|uniref:Uncharacterized protein n=1 Tax=Forsythia ovata TaxID=205694 RepID=A0ABD1UX90_9LAMI
MFNEYVHNRIGEYDGSSFLCVIVPHGRNFIRDDDHHVDGLNEGLVCAIAMDEKKDIYNEDVNKEFDDKNDTKKVADKSVTVEKDDVEHETVEKQGVAKQTGNE